MTAGQDTEENGLLEIVEEDRMMLRMKNRNARMSIHTEYYFKMVVSMYEDVHLEH